MVTNVPGLDLGAGAEVMEYIPPFQVTFLHKGDSCTGTCICTCGPPQTMLFPVFLYFGLILIDAD